MRELIRNILREHLSLTEAGKPKWTKEEVLKLASEYSQMNHFKKNHYTAYAAAQRNGWLEDIRKGMKPAYISWTKEMVHQEALKYPTRRQFQTHSKKAYQVARYNGWLDDVTGHMENKQNLWNPDDIWREALKYNHVRDFIEGSPNAYQAARRRPNYKEIISHMTPLGNRLKRLIYAYEFPDNSVYVGLTFDLGERDRQHRKKESSRVFQHIQSTGLEPNFIQVTDDFVSAVDAKILEQQTIERYANEGWQILNLAKAGGLGSSVLDDWTKEMVLEVAKKYQTRTEFCSKERRACLLAKRNGWYDEATSHMINFTEDWDFEKIHNEALKYQNRTKFKKESPAAYSAAHRLGIIDDVTSHMGEPKFFGAHNKIWDNIETARQELNQYSSIGEVRKNNPGLYNAIHRNGWQELFRNLDSKKEEWTDEKIIEDAKKYTSVIDFRNNSNKAYNAAKRRGLISQIRKIYGQEERVSWDREKVLKELPGYRNYTEFIKNSPKAHAAAKRMKLLDFIRNYYSLK